jgi:hypothetical protein
MQVKISTIWVVLCITIKGTTEFIGSEYDAHSSYQQAFEAKGAY